MGLLGKIWVKLGLDNSEFKQGMQGAQKEASGFQNYIKGIGQGILAAFSIGAVVNFGKAAVKAYNEQAVAMAKMEAVIKSTGASAGLTAKQLGRYASELQQVTIFGDETSMEAMSRLLTFKSIQGQTFKDTIKSAQDLATVMGTDLNSAVMQLGKALEQPEIGLTMLRRSGISFSNEQIEQIKRLVDEGKKHEAQLIILAEVQSQFGGAAKAAADTAQGAWTQVTNAIGDLMEVMGSSIEPTKGFAQSIAVVLGQVGNVISSERLSFFEKLSGLFKPSTWAKAAEEVADNAKKQDALSQSVNNVIASLKGVSDAEAKLKSLRKEGGGEYEQLLRSALKTYIIGENQKKAAADEAAEAARKAAAEEAKFIEGNINYQERLISQLRERIKLETDEEKRAGMSQDLANLERQLEVMKMRTAELRDYKALIARGQTPLPAVKHNIQGKAVVQGQVDPIKGLKTQSDATLGELRDFNDELQGEVVRSANITAQFGQTVAKSFSDSMRVIFDAIASGEKIDSSALAKALLMPFADMAVQIGEVLIASGVGAIAAKSLISNPYTAIAAGAALVMIGTAAQAAIGSIGANLGKGGGSGNYTYGTTIGGMGANWQPTQQSINVNLTGVLKGQDIYLAVEKTKANKSR